MNNVKVSRKYARALYELTEMEGLSISVLDTLEYLEQALTVEPVVFKFLGYTLIDKNDRKKVLENIIELSGREVPAILVNFLKLLVDRNRMPAFMNIAECYRILFQEGRGIQAVKVITPTLLKTEYRDKLISSLEAYTGKKVNLEEETDTEMVAGMIIRIGTKVLDGSLTARLSRVKEHLLSPV